MTTQLQQPTTDQYQIEAAQEDTSAFQAFEEGQSMNPF
jgi:hypothetical protein